MADQQQQPQSAKAQMLNDRTYQEVEYLKRNLGPILVAALAEICIRRPADPIEYLGHWLLRWRYNEELKRRDVENALEVVKQKAWTKDDEKLTPNPTAPDQPPAPQQFTQGFLPGAPYAPPGYGGPLDPNAVEQLAPTEEAPPQPQAADAPTSAAPAEEPQAEGEAVLEPGDGNEEKRASQVGEKRLSGEKKASVSGERGSNADKRPSQPGATGSGEVKRTSGTDQGEARRMSMEKRTSGDKRASLQEDKRPSGELQQKQPSGDVQVDANNPEEPAPAESEPAVDAEPVVEQ
ncbi:unnamed protein product [Orchesella dallaii]|uniref:DPY30 domain-containing protein 2 n=1 Tax=Orchesella dallaii TaxID=48710 RepID=A0ABP1Q6Q8_9HEXA